MKNYYFKKRNTRSITNILSFFSLFYSTITSTFWRPVKIAMFVCTRWGMGNTSRPSRAPMAKMEPWSKWYWIDLESIWRLPVQTKLWPFTISIRANAWPPCLVILNWSPDSNSPMIANILSQFLVRNFVGFFWNFFLLCFLKILWGKITEDNRPDMSPFVVLFIYFLLGIRFVKL